MKYLALVAALFATGASAQTAQELMQNPYWTVDNYNVGYCLHRDAFYAEAGVDGIEVDSSDVDLEVYIRESFDILIGQAGIRVIGQRPTHEEFICP